MISFDSLVPENTSILKDVNIWNVGEFISCIWKTMFRIVWKPPENPIFSEKRSFWKRLWRSISMLVCFYTCKNCLLKLYVIRICMYWKTLGKPDVFLILWTPWIYFETIATHEVIITRRHWIILSMIICYKRALRKRLVYSNTNDPVGVVRTNHVIQPSWLRVVPHPKRKRTRRPRWLH